MSYAQIEALRAAQDRVREVCELVRAPLIPATNPAAVEARDDSIAFLDGASKRLEDAIKALAPLQKETA